MQIVRASEIDSFLNCRGRASSLEDLKNEPLMLQEFSARFRMPESFGKVLAAAQIITTLFDFDKWALLIVEERGIWPNWEDLHTWRCLLAEAHQDNDIAEGDALLFSGVDAHRIFSFVQMLSNFHWTFRLVGDCENFHFAMTHDDDAFLYSDNMTQEISEGLAKAVE